MNMLQGLISIAPLFSIMAAGSVFLKWFHRSQFERGLVKKLKQIAVEKDVQLPFHNDNEISLFLRDNLSFEKIMEDIVTDLNIENKYSP